MQPGAKRKASGLVALLLTPLRARDHVVGKLGMRWAILADGLIVGVAVGSIAALVFDVPGEARLGIFAGLVALGAGAGAAIGARRGKPPKRQNDTQP